MLEDWIHLRGLTATHRSIAMELEAVGGSRVDRRGTDHGLPWRNRMMVRAGNERAPRDFPSSPTATRPMGTHGRGDVEQAAGAMMVSGAATEFSSLLWKSF